VGGGKTPPSNKSEDFGNFIAELELQTIKDLGQCPKK
jgi:hypothetical protein